MPYKLFFPPIVLLILVLAFALTIEAAENNETGQKVALADKSAAVLPPALTLDEAAATLFGHKVKHGAYGSRRVALTFDDGPHPTYTMRVVESLQRKQAPATFFMLGDMVEKNPHIARAVAEAGFEIGSHSFKHAKMTTRDAAFLRQDHQRTSDAIRRATGREVHLFRPPYGSVNSMVESVCRDLGMVMVLWSVDPRDWEARASVDSIISTALSQVRGGGIVCMHDTKPRTLEALPGLIDALRARGYELTTVGELLREAVKLGEAQALDSAPDIAPEKPLDPLVIPLDMTVLN